MSINELEFQEVYDAFQPKIFRYMARMVGDTEAEDLTQEVFVKVQRALKDFRGDAKLSTWLYRIAINTALDKLRSPSFQQMDQASIIEALDQTQKPFIEKELIRDETNDCLRGYIKKLPEDYRVVLVLSEWEGLRNNAIAEILGVTLETVKIRLHRAKEKLKEDLEAHCDPHWIEENEFLPDLKEFLGNLKD
jgi:RNA polymerase sigma-70 factor, ECF subfamily